jgi:drug/metabolite transporter (DMT)-like permease
MTLPDQRAAPAAPRFRLFRRGPWEIIATLLIAAGVLMLLQPFSITLYGWSFATTLTGVILFTFVSKFPD